MCKLCRCVNCMKYAVTGCNDAEHQAAQIARVEPAQRCRCRAEQMAAFNAAADATPPTQRSTP